MTFNREDVKALVTELVDYHLEHDDSSEQNKTRQSLIDRYLNFYRLPKSDDRVTHRVGNVYTDKHRIAVQSWVIPNSKGTQWLVHGYLDHLGSCQRLIHWMLDAGWSVVAFDLPGHGLSSGKRASIDSFDEYRDALSKTQQSLKSFPRPWGGVGHSTGASILMTNICCYPRQKPLDSAILIAPLVRPKMWRLLQMVYPFYRVAVHKTRRVFNESTHDQEFINFQSQKDPMQPRWIHREWLDAMNRWYHDFRDSSSQPVPIKILQGDADLTVDFRYNVEVIRRIFPDTEVAMVAGGRHHLINESEQYLKPVETFIRRWL